MIATYYEKQKDYNILNYYFSCIAVLDFGKSVVFSFYYQTDLFKHKHSSGTDVFGEGNLLLGIPCPSWSLVSQTNFGTRTLCGFWCWELVLKFAQVLRLCRGSGWVASLCPFVLFFPFPILVPFTDPYYPEFCMSINVTSITSICNTGSKEEV